MRKYDDFNTKINLVTKNGDKIGEISKLDAHKQGELHEAYSLFIFNNKKELLIQQRAISKYHSGGLWSNTCCSHPPANSDTSLNILANDRLVFEMGISCDDLKEIGAFYYKEYLDNGIIEHEYDHILIGYCNSIPQPNPKEVKCWKWVSIELLYQEIKKNPDKYTIWLRSILNKYNLHSFN